MSKCRYALFLLAAGLMAEPEWTRYRGPNGTGLSSDTGLPTEIGPEKNVVWKTKTLKGNSSPIVVQGRVIFTGHDGDERAVLCYDAAKGTQLWRAAVKKTRTEVANPNNGPTTPSPATDGRHVFALFPEYGLLAYDLDGKEQWRVPLGPFTAIQGMAVSPVVADGKVVLLVDTPDEAYLVAFDARTGNQAWKVDRPLGFLGSYTTPSVYEPKGGPAQIVVSGAVELTGYQARTGERLWWARGVTVGPAALPLISGDSVYTLEPGGEPGPPFSQMLKAFDKNGNGTIEVAEVPTVKLNDQIMHRLFRSIDKLSGNGDGVVTDEEFTKAFTPSGGGLVRTRLGGKGDVSHSHIVWRYAKGLPYVTAPLLHNGVLYVINTGGILSTFDPATGTRLRQDRLKDAPGEYYASPIAGDGKIYFASKEGKVSVIKAGAEWELLSSADFGEQVIATPAIAGGRIFLRAEQTLYCFSERR